MLSIIVGMGRNHEIGKGGKLPWHLKPDMKRFKELTTGHTIIMGRHTFESLPKVLPEREHIVVTRDRSFKVDDPRVQVVYELEPVLTEAKQSSEEVFIIGGGSVYEESLEYADALYLTRIDQTFEADTFFPHLEADDWQVDERSGLLYDKESGLRYEFVNLSRWKEPMI